MNIAFTMKSKRMLLAVLAGGMKTGAGTGVVCVSPHCGEFKWRGELVGYRPFHDFFPKASMNFRKARKSW